MEPTWLAGRLVILGDLEGPSEVEDPTLLEALEGVGDPRSARAVLIRFGEGDLDPVREALDGFGVADVRSLDVRDREAAEQAHAVGLVERASVVFLSGEDPLDLARLLDATKLDAALRRRLDGPMILVASGPAAPAVGAWVLVDGPDGPTTEAGLGYLPRAILDPEYARDDRLDRLRAALAGRPGALGIGLGEGATLVARGSAFEVRGEGAVAVVAGPTETAEAAQHLLRRGDRFDLRARIPGP